MAGAAVELSDALLINPNDMDQIEQAIVKALEMPGAGAAETAEENAAHRLGANREPLGREFYQRVELGPAGKTGR